MSYKTHQVDVKIEVCVELIILKASESLVVCTVEVSDLPMDEIERLQLNLR
jgi:hypothetical protein